MWFVVFNTQQAKEIKKKEKSHHHGSRLTHQPSTTLITAVLKHLITSTSAVHNCDKNNNSDVGEDNSKYFEWHDDAMSDLSRFCNIFEWRHHISLLDDLDVSNRQQPFDLFRTSLSSLVLRMLTTAMSSNNDDINSVLCLSASTFDTIFLRCWQHSHC